MKQRLKVKQYPPFRDNSLEQLARALADVLTHADITALFNRLKLEDSGGSKWSRMFHAFQIAQGKNNKSNRVLVFILQAMDPVRFIERREIFSASRSILNKILAFNELSLTDSGEFNTVKRAHTIEDTEQGVKGMSISMNLRNFHPEVMKHCRKELKQNNYFHAVFEASKGLAERIRSLSGVEEDGDKLVDKVFLIKHPIIAFNSMSTSTEESVHRGLAFLLKGCFAAIRNPLAHQPSIHWEDQDNAADYLSLMSLLHRKLDDHIVNGEE